MASSDVFGRFQIKIEDELLQKLLSPDQTVDTELWTDAQQESAGDNKPSRCSLHLGKSSNALLSLFLTVYRSDVEDQSQLSQTEKINCEDRNMQTGQIDTQHSAMQTVTKEQIQNSVQTDKNAVVHIDSQTEKNELANIHSQTEKNELANIHSQTEKNELANIHSQTEKNELANIHSQTEKKIFSDIHSQTLKKTFATIESQTEFEVVLVQPKCDQQVQAGTWSPCDSMNQTDLSMLSMFEGGCQTEIFQDECASQTDPPLTEDQDTQTFIKTKEHAAQTVRDDKEVGSQASVTTSLCLVQTDSSLANLVDAQAQAVVEVQYQECQASVESSTQEMQAGASLFMLSDQEAQAGASLFMLSDQEAQAVAESVEGGVQTDVKEEVERFVQTELCTNQAICQTEQPPLEDRDSQTLIEVSEAEIQTMPIEEPPNVVIEQVVEESQATDSQELNASQISSIDEVPDYHTEIIAPGKLLYEQHVPTLCEEGCQTDPVTIIIGDASFLVKKLKSSALSPTKVSSMGNEIEIELRADEEEVPAPSPYDLPEKENTVHVQPQMMRPRGMPSAMRARGVRTRGGANIRGVHMVNPSVQRMEMGYYHSKPGVPGPQYYASTAGGVGKYSCPVCADTFHESPALYEHLQLMHAEAFNMIKKPRGREGKTIVIPKRVTPEPEPPVLTPMEPITMGATHHVVDIIQQGSKMPPPEPQSVGLFEDPGQVWQSPNKSRKRTLARRQITDEDSTIAVQEAPYEEVHVMIQPPQLNSENIVEAGEYIPIIPINIKRKRGDLENLEIVAEALVKRVRTEDSEEQQVTEEVVTETAIIEEMPTDQQPEMPTDQQPEMLTDQQPEMLTDQQPDMPNDQQPELTPEEEHLVQEEPVQQEVQEFVEAEEQPEPSAEPELTEEAPAQPEQKEDSPAATTPKTRARSTRTIIKTEKALAAEPPEDSPRPRGRPQRTKTPKK